VRNATVASRSCGSRAGSVLGTIVGGLLVGIDAAR